MCMFLPMEIVTFSEKVKVVEVGSLVEIPSEIQIRQAISELYKKKEEHPDTFSYIKFPFGMIDFDGLKRLQSYHEYVALKTMVAEEKAWLKQAKQNYCEGLGVNVDKINQHFEENVWCSTDFNQITPIRNLVGKRWLTDDVIESVFDIINLKHDDMICFVCKPTRIMYSSKRFNDKVRSIRDNGVTVSKVLIALNVGCENTGTCYVSDEKRPGVPPGWEGRAPGVGHGGDRHPDRRAAPNRRQPRRAARRPQRAGAGPGTLGSANTRLEKWYYILW